MMKLLRNNPAVVGLVVVAIVIGLAYVLWPSGGTKTLTADFPRTVSLYEGSDVRILGVPVGKVESVTPMGTYVRAKIEYDDKYTLPADVKAVIISPSIVGDRFVQLTPATGKGAFPDGGELSTERTAVPLELDAIFGSLSDLSYALGPNGANAPDQTGKGALSRLLDSTARNFGGQGTNFNTTLRNLGQLSQTLSNNKDNLFGAQAAVEQFVKALADNDQTVRQFTQSLTAGASMLAEDRNDLASALDNLATALDQVRSFVSENRESLTSNIAGLTRISETLVKRRTELAEILKTAPLALNNLSLAYNGKSGTLDTRANIGETVNAVGANPQGMVCAFLESALGKGGLCPTGRAAAGEVKKAQKAQQQSVDPTLGGLVMP